MLALLKNPKAGTEKNSVKAWRVDFRNQAKLPDVKTVRTGFAVNTAMLAVIGGILMFGVHREITVANLKTEISEIEARIKTEKKENDKALVLYREYQKEEKIIKEVQAFEAGSFDFINFIVAFSRQLPPGVKVKKVDFRASDQPVTIAGEISGSDASATAKADQFITALKNDEQIRTIFTSITMPKLVRDTVADSLDYELVLKLK
ncbi:MAG: hypothetical protein NTU80_14315 [Verrucomicrobia bacterium]|nr:hypothetical protein [Verrucomicrobiota bacterium]